jgi:hypothetical protein
LGARTPRNVAVICGVDARVTVCSLPVTKSSSRPHT